MFTHCYSYILVLGPYFGCFGSLLGPYFTKKNGSLSQSLGVHISFGCSVNGDCGLKNVGLLRGTAPLMVIFVQEKLSKSLPSVVVRSRSRNAGGRGDCLPKRPVG